ncbi:3-phosphoglycerate dehydrogenase [Salipiger pallidus]|uniref:3-phosphoglycerate dehydrogenase n=1 Tax=Salipiger pallidus TaxID=1775170 RepID=A0A8J2ZML1_9RHOB|nr:phosphoglycerate dehydrogenase [Salipiger pallidus]GGG83640.1 3-phosphoglycerate dehydrogenase [Salipiger pallidus]
MAEANRILVNTEQFAPNDPIFAPLREAGYDVRVNETGLLPTEDQLIELLKDGVVATIAGGEPYTAKVLESAPDLKIIARWGVGFDKVDTAAATGAGIPVAMAFGTNHESVAEYAYAMALSLACRLGPRDAMVRGGAWTFDGFHAGMWGRTAGVIGLGRIGGAFARRCQAAQMTILVHDPYATPEQLAELGARSVDLDELFTQADVISVHAPSTPQTRHTVNAARLAQMKPGAILVNTSRGPLIDEAALCDALESGHLGGVGLDVFETEPLPAGSRLRSFDNVLLSPHVSGMDEMARQRVTERCMQSILSCLEGDVESLRPYLANPDFLSQKTGASA